MGIKRADVARYLLLLQFGGVYMDLDMELKGPIQPVSCAHEFFFNVHSHIHKYIHIHTYIHTLKYILHTAHTVHEYSPLSPSEPIF
jgi:mannosyltransferase OCH1-like enzyme